MVRTIAVITVATLALAAVAYVFSVGSASAQVADPDAPISVKVSFADLDLDSNFGASHFLTRVRKAAATACGGEPDIRTLDRRDFILCREQAITKTVDALHAPLVTAMAGRPSKLLLAGR